MASDCGLETHGPCDMVPSAKMWCRYMPREFATAMMVHVSMQPKLMNILQVRTPSPCCRDMQSAASLSDTYLLVTQKNIAS